MSFHVGQTVGSYQITGLIGAGGMGRVYKVEHSITRRVEAMKVVLEAAMNSQEVADRFLREIQVQASLRHPNIASVHNAFWVEDDLVMVMELVEGESIERRMERGRLALETSIDYLCQALSALSYAHSRGVVHRDLTPANLMVTPQGTVKLTDFGLARAPGDTRLTQSGTVLGSLHYMSPEQAMGSQTIDARSDLYSAGAVLYELATGRKPFEYETAFSLMKAHVEEAPTSPSQRAPGLPPALDGIILTAMAKGPQERFDSADAFRSALSALLAGAPESSPKPAGRRRLWLGATAAAALILLVVGVWPRRPAPAPAVPATVPAPSVGPAARPAPSESRPADPRSGAVAAAPTTGSSKGNSSALPSPAPRVESDGILLPRGTPLIAQTTTRISTNTHKSGDSFFAHLKEPLMAGERLLAPKGTVLQGRVVEADKGGRVKGRARLSVRLVHLRTPDGREAPIRTNAILREARSTRGRDAKTIGMGGGAGGVVGALSGGPVGAAIGAGIGAGASTGLTLFRRGPPAVLPSESTLAFRLAFPAKIPAR